MIPIKKLDMFGLNYKHYRFVESYKHNLILKQSKCIMHLEAINS